MSTKKSTTNKRIKIMGPSVQELSSPLLSSLLESRHRRNIQYRQLLRFNPLSLAFDELLACLEFLSRINNLDPEIVHLLDVAQQWVIDGVDHILSQSDPDSPEESRKLLELEFLFRDFAATPDQLDIWKSMESWKRHKLFGFSELRKREEKRQGLDSETVLAQRDYWITHSIESHPKPIKDVRPITEDGTRSLLSSLGDILHHAASVVEAAAICVQAQGITIPDEFSQLSREAYQTCTDKIRTVLHSHIPDETYESLRQPRPQKQVSIEHWNKKVEKE